MMKILKVKNKIFLLIIKKEHQFTIENIKRKYEIKNRIINNNINEIDLYYIVPESKKIKNKKSNDISIENDIKKMNTIKNYKKKIEKENYLFLLKC